MQHNCAAISQDNPKGNPVQAAGTAHRVRRRRLKDGITYVFLSEITGRDRESYDTLSLQNFNDGHRNSETRHGRKTVSLQDLFEIYDQLTPWVQSPSRTPIQQLNKTHELTLTKSQTVWTLVDSCLDFDVLTEYGLTYQNRHYTITETYKSL